MEETLIPKNGNLDSPSETVEELWENPGITTVVIRRHGEWAQNNNLPKGCLTPEGIVKTKESVKDLCAKIPKDSDIKIYESPSFMIGSVERPDKSLEIYPQRARQTASIYEAKIFGVLSEAKRDERGGVKKDYVGNPLSSLRVEDNKLGDLFESATEETGKYITDFFEAVDGIYGIDTKAFWRDFETDNLQDSLKQLLYKAGGSDALQLAINIANFTNIIYTQKNDSKKNVSIAISHGETINSFLYYVTKFLKHEKVITEGDLTGVISFDEGFDIHIKDGHATILVEENRVEVDFINFLYYLNDLNKKTERCSK